MGYIESLFWFIATKEINVSMILKTTLKYFNINLDTWKYITQRKTAWMLVIRHGSSVY
jgi:hypothetical protein